MKKVLLPTAFALTFALCTHGALAVLLATGSGWICSVAFLLLLALLLLNRAACRMLEKACGFRANKTTAIVLCGALVLSVGIPFLLCALPVWGLLQIYFHALLFNRALWMLGAYALLIPLCFLENHLTRRQTPLASFEPMNTRRGMQMVRWNAYMRALMAVVMAALMALVMLLYEWQMTWGLLLLAVTPFAVSLVYGLWVNKKNLALFNDELDPAAYYDVMVDFYQRARGKKQQMSYLQNILSAYIAMGQEDVARELAQRAQDEPKLPLVRVIFDYTKISLCTEYKLFLQQEVPLKAELARLKRSKVTDEITLLLDGCRAQLAQHPQGLLWYANMLEQQFPSAYHHVQAASCRAEAYGLLGDTAAQRAELLEVAQHGGGLALRTRAAAQLKAMDGASSAVETALARTQTEPIAVREDTVDTAAPAKTIQAEPIAVREDTVDTAAPAKTIQAETTASAED